MLTVLVEQMAAAYPHQELGESLEILLRGYELLVTRHGLRRLRNVLESLLIEPGRRFFPLPGEVSEKLEELALLEKQQIAKDQQRQREMREAEEFDTFLSERIAAGDSMDSVLARFPALSRSWLEWKRSAA